MKLTPHFSLAELTFSETAQRKQINNTPPPVIVQNLHLLAAGLEDVRAALGGLPLRINSGYRCPKLNRAVGGARAEDQTEVGALADLAVQIPLRVVLAYLEDLLSGHAVQVGAAGDHVQHGLASGV